MSVLCAALFSALLPQAEPEPAPPQLSVVTGALDAGRVMPARLGFGDGGVTQPTPAADEERTDGDRRRRAAEASSETGRRTPGGARVRALGLGARIDLPSGAGVLVDSDGRVHLKDGSQTRPNRDGVRLWLGDGASVTVLPDRRADRPVRLVALARDGRGVGDVLWRTRVARRVDPRALRRARDLWVLGAGDVIYRAVPIGPLLVLERVLCSRAAAATGDHPEHAVAVLGDVLGASLVRLQAHARQHGGNDMRMQRRATALSRMANEIIPHGKRFVRPDSAVDQPIVALGDAVRLKVRAVPGGSLAVELLVPDRQPPLLEWSIGYDTILHLISENDDGRVFYAMQGMRLGKLTEGLVGYEVTSTELGRARQVLFRLQSRQPKPARRR